MAFVGRYGCLFVNAAGTIARMVDAARGIHTWYADQGEVFDTEHIQQLVNSRLLEIGVRVMAGKGVKKPVAASKYGLDRTGTDD